MAFLRIGFPIYMKDPISFLKAHPVSLTLKAKRKVGYLKRKKDKGSLCPEPRLESPLTPQRLPPHHLSVTLPFRPRGPVIREHTDEVGKGWEVPLTFVAAVSVGIGSFGHADWTSVDRLQPGKTPGFLNRGGSKGLGGQGFSHCRMTRVSLALLAEETWCPMQEAPTQWLSGELGSWQWPWGSSPTHSQL